MGCAQGKLSRPPPAPPVSLSRQKLNRLLPRSYSSYTELVVEVKKLMRYRAETIQQLNWVADELDERHRDVNIAKLVGSGAGVIGAGIAGFGIVITPITLGAGAIVAVAGGAVMTAGSATAAGAHLTEKVLEKVDLDKVQKAVDKDNEQCKKVQELWKEFDGYCSSIIETIQFVDPSEEPDMNSLKTWVIEAVKKTESAIDIIYKAFSAAQKIRTAGDVSRPENLCSALLEKAMEVAQGKAIAHAMSHSLKAIGVAGGFVLIAAIGLANLIVFITTAIDMHKGSLSKVAREVREKSSQLEAEYERWKEIFPND